MSITASASRRKDRSRLRPRSPWRGPPARADGRVSACSRLRSSPSRAVIVSVRAVSPAVTAYHMTFEPSLFVADASGTIVARLDSIWDTVELTAALDLAAGTG